MRENDGSRIEKQTEEEKAEKEKEEKEKEKEEVFNVARCLDAGGLTVEIFIDIGRAKATYEAECFLFFVRREVEKRSRQVAE